MKFKLAVAGAALASLALTGCGADSSYCSDLEAAQEDFGSLSGSGDPEQIDEAFSTLREIAQDAPDEVAEEWETLDGTIEQIQTALDEAGITLAELSQVQGDELPEGVTQEDVTALVTEIQSIGSAETQEASETIETHASEECDIELTE
ncbi:hypothetical protein ACHAAC_05445 [Aeromicrobium sp. CF4.19]|uniref:hypothetical protein n=1 Tax=Aeromicrobium sp. CF4.19 TaxID=3373082 RepID=UPI003EE61B20